MWGGGESSTTVTGLWVLLSFNDNVTQDLVNIHGGATHNIIFNDLFCGPKHLKDVIDP